MGETLKRIGRFSISYQVIDEDPLMALLMLSGKLIVRAEARHEMHAVEYHAYCDEFDEVATGQQIPEYIAELSQQEIAENNSDGSPGGTIKIINVFQRWVNKCEI